MENHFPNHRLRRLRRSSALRDLVRETELNVKDFIMPLFIKYGNDRKDPISSMPGLFQFSPDNLAQEITEIKNLGIPGVILFGIPEHKDAIASSSYDKMGVIPQAIQVIKEIAPDMMVISDICCCEYTSHSHCGIIQNPELCQDVDNDSTLEVLVKQALCHAQAGADMVAPSGMMDGQVGAIRQALDTSGYSHIPILGYSAKYASGLYGPFRQAANSGLQFGDRKTYQMDPANGNEALREVELDLIEGADMVMVKPASLYLDVIYRVKQKFPHVPLAAYQVGGEYAMIKAAAEKGWIDEKAVALEVITGIKRAGADIIINYFSKELATLL